MLNMARKVRFLDKYKIQIKYYKDAVEKITGKEVKECYLYLFGLNKEEKMNLQINSIKNIKSGFK